MSIEKRRRGRPRGSGKNDAPYLAQVADFLLRDPSLKPTTAMKRVVAGRKDWSASDETLLRRWQIKWKEQGQALMAAARERARPRPATPVTPLSLWAVAHGVNSTEIKALIERKSAWMQAIIDVQNSPTLRQWDEAIRAMQNSPALKQWDETIRAMRNSPTMRAIAQAAPGDLR
jgi:hypothetical protein